MTSYDPKAGRTAYDTTSPIFNAYTPEQLVPRTCNAKNAVVHVLTVAEVVETEKLAPKFAEVGNFGMRHLENLRPLAWATWHCVFQLDTAETAEGKRQVDPKILERATKRRKRMFSMLSYHLGDDPAVAGELAAIQSGSGHLDVAGDLTRLTPLFERHHDLLSRDPTHYNPDDLEGAPADAEAILQSLAESPDSAHWQDQLDRAFTALAEAYGEVRAAAQWIWRKEPETAELFVSLWTAARAPSPGSSKSRSTWNTPGCRTSWAAGLRLMLA